MKWLCFLTLLSMTSNIAFGSEQVLVGEARALFSGNGSVTNDDDGPSNPARGQIEKLAFEDLRSKCQEQGGEIFSDDAALIGKDAGFNSRCVVVSGSAWNCYSRLTARCEAP